MRFCLGLGLALALAGSAQAEIVVRTIPPAGLKRIQLAAESARDEFDKVLLDYPSARFRDVRAIVGPQGTVEFCGFVNARNPMGAYTGWTEFNYNELRGPDVAMRPDRDIIVDAFCHGGNGIQDTRDWSKDLTHR